MKNFIIFLKLLRKDLSIDWIMYRMNELNVSFLDALVSYVTY